MKGLSLKFSMNATADRTLKMFDHGFMELRAKAIQRYLVHEAAKVMLEQVKAKIPEDKRYTSYRDALQLVQSGSPSDPSFGIRLNEAKSDVVEPTSSLIYFKTKSKKRPPELDVLIKYQPWTQETLPFTADPKFAQMVIRKVSAREVSAVSKARDADKQKWQRELNQLGVRTDQKKGEPPKGEAVEDLVYTALRLEFGLGNTKAVAHWRPAARLMPALMSKRFEKGKFADALMNWKNTSWKKWRTLSEPQVPPSNDSTFADKIM